MRIEYKGLYTDESQLALIEPKENERRFEEVDDINAQFAMGFKLSTPLIITSVIVGFIICQNAISSKAFLLIYICFILGNLTAFLFVFIHEIIHGIFYPKDAKIDVFRTRYYQSMFVYCTATVSKYRFIGICLAPNLILGFIPLFITVIFKNILPQPIMVYFAITSIIMIVSGVGDYYNIYNAIYQVPSNGLVYNNGFHSYWYVNAEEEWCKNNNSIKAYTLSLLAVGLVLLARQSIASIIVFLILELIVTVNKGIWYTIFRWICVLCIFYYLILL